MTENHQGHGPNIPHRENKQVSKSQLPYLIREALETGSWRQVELKQNHEIYERGSEIVTIGTTPLRGTEPPSMVYNWEDRETGTRISSRDVINSLSAKLAKRK